MGAMTGSVVRSSRASTRSCSTSSTTAPAPGKGGTGVFTLDGKEMARKTLEHTIPLMMTIDETFDVGVDTRPPVDDSYALPFRFNGTIDKLTFKRGPSQLAAADQKAAAAGVAAARD